LLCNNINNTSKFDIEIEYKTFIDEEIVVEYNIVNKKLTASIVNTISSSNIKKQPILGSTVKRVLELHRIMGHVSGSRMSKAIREGNWINLPGQDALSSQMVDNRIMTRVKCTYNM
jgi:hypothetical protein